MAAQPPFVATALEAFRARTKDELSFKEGEQVVVVEINDDLYKGILAKDRTKEGWFPDYYVRAEPKTPIPPAIQSKLQGEKTPTELKAENKKKAEEEKETKKKNEADAKARAKQDAEEAKRKEAEDKVNAAAARKAARAAGKRPAGHRGGGKKKNGAAGGPGTGGSKSKVFATALGQTMFTSYTSFELPQIYVATRDFLLENDGLSQEGLFRISGSSAEINDWRTKYDAGEPPTFRPPLNCHSVAGLLKLFLRELPEPLLSWELYDSFVAAAGIANRNAKLDRFCQLLESLYPTNRLMTIELISFLTLVAQQSDVNKMTPSNIGIVFGPTLLKKKEENIVNMATTCEVVRFMIEVSAELKERVATPKTLDAAQQAAAAAAREEESDPSATGGDGDGDDDVEASEDPDDSVSGADGGGASSSTTADP